jgi:cytoskeletal protein CcmA (bactofilin family)
LKRHSDQVLQEITQLSKFYDELLKGAEQSRVLPGMSNRSTETARVGAGLHVRGQIYGNEDLQVNGSVEGPIQLGNGKVTVGASGRIIGDIGAREIVVHGSITGNLRAVDHIEIKAAGSVLGDIETARIITEDGAHFKGSIEIGHKVTEAARATQAFAATAAPHSLRPGDQFPKG